MEDQDHPLRSAGRRPLTPGTSREAVPNSNQRTDRDGVVSCGSKALPWMAGLRKYRPFAGARRTGQIDPLLPFEIGLVNGREAQESGLRPSLPRK